MLLGTDLYISPSCQTYGLRWHILNSSIGRQIVSSETQAKSAHGVTVPITAQQGQVQRDLRLLLSPKVGFCCGARVGQGGRYEACCLPVTSCSRGRGAPTLGGSGDCKGESQQGCAGAASSSTES